MGSFWRDFATSDEGMLPLTPNQIRRFTMGVASSYVTGGRDGVSEYMTQRAFDSDFRAFDIPGTDWDDDYTIWELAEDVDELHDTTAELVQDIFTDIFALFGGIFATAINMIGAPNIDDMAIPPVELGEYDGIFMPALRTAAGFGHHNMPDCPLIMFDLQPTFTVMEDARRIFAGFRPSDLRFGDSVEGTRSAIFRWRGNNPTSEAWV